MSSTVHSPFQPIPPRISIPKQHNGWFMWVLLALAALVVAGVVYSFWRIASVPSPELDVPPNPALQQPTP